MIARIFHSCIILLLTDVYHTYLSSSTASSSTLSPLLLLPSSLLLPSGFYIFFFFTSYLSSVTPLFLLFFIFRFQGQLWGHERRTVCDHATLQDMQTWQRCGEHHRLLPELQLVCRQSERLDDDVQRRRKSSVRTLLRRWMALSFPYYILLLLVINNIIKRCSLTRVKLIALYKHLMTKTTLKYISNKQFHSIISVPNGIYALGKVQM